MSVGETLRSGREAQQLAVTDVAARLAIPVEWVEDLEADRFEAFGNEVHAQAAVRLYAELLQMDAEALLGTGQVSVRSTGATFEPRVADPATRQEMITFLVRQALRSPDSARVLGIVAVLEVLAGVSVVIVRAGG